MASRRTVPEASTVSRENLIELLNEDLARAHQAIISCVVYSRALKGAQFMNIAAELERHASEELAHALLIAGQIDYLGGMPLTVAKLVKISARPQDMLRFGLDNQNDMILHYRERVRQCEALGEFAMAEHVREILVHEQDHQVALASALGIEVPNVADARDTAIDEHSRINAGITRNPNLVKAEQTEPAGALCDNPPRRTHVGQVTT